jgi:hypothetical protein
MPIFCEEVTRSASVPFVESARRFAPGANMPVPKLPLKVYDGATAVPAFPMICPVAVNTPTIVDDACATKPLMSVERPFTERVPNVAVLPFTVVEVEIPNVPVPFTVKVPIAAVFPLSVVEVAVPKKPIPLAVNAVEEAYGRMDAIVVEVATT